MPVSSIPPVASSKSERSVLEGAPFAALTSFTKSAEAVALIEHITDGIERADRASGARVYKSDKRREKLRIAIEAFVGDLLIATAAATPYLRRSQRAKDFTGQLIGYNTFKRARDGLKRAGLVKEVPAFNHIVEFEGGAPIATERFTARFAATPKLIAVASTLGVPLNSISFHFGQPAMAAPTKVLELRNASRRLGNRKVHGVSRDFKVTPHTRRLKKEVEVINAFLVGFTLTGGVHRGFKRIFNNGDDPKFKWDMGGRLYSIGPDTYQMLSDDKRLKLKINGEPVSEIDVKASYLTILYASHHRKLPIAKGGDPYAVPGLPRDVVKHWVKVQLGNGAALSRWPPKITKEYAKDHEGRKLAVDYPLKSVAAAVSEKYPLLKNRKSLRDTWAVLMFRESKAILQTVQALMKRGVPSFPVFDSIIVPRSKTETAAAILKQCYRGVCGVEPILDIEPLR